MRQASLLDYTPKTTLDGEYGMSVAEVASALGVSGRTVHRRVKAGLIRSVLVTPRRRVVLASEVSRLFTEGCE